MYRKFNIFVSESTIGVGMQYLTYFEGIEEEDDEEWIEPHNKEELDKRNAQTVQFMNSLKLGDYLVYYWDYQPVDYSVEPRTVPHLIKLIKVSRIHTDHDTQKTYPVYHYKELSIVFKEGDPERLFNGWDAYVQKVVCITRNVEEAWKVYNELLPQFMKKRERMLTQKRFDL